MEYRQIIKMSVYNRWFSCESYDRIISFHGHSAPTFGVPTDPKRHSHALTMDAPFGGVRKIKKISRDKRNAQTKLLQALFAHVYDGTVDVDYSRPCSAI